MDHAEPFKLDDFNLEMFPNGDGLSCEKEYSLPPGSRTLIRGTLRYRDFSRGIKGLQRIGLFDLSKQTNIPSTEITWVGRSHPATLENGSSRLPFPPSVNTCASFTAFR